MFGDVVVRVPLVVDSVEGRGRVLSGVEFQTVTVRDAVIAPAGMDTAQGVVPSRLSVMGSAVLYSKTPPPGVGLLGGRVVDRAGGVWEVAGLAESYCSPFTGRAVTVWRLKKAEN